MVVETALGPKRSWTLPVLKGCYNKLGKGERGGTGI